MDLQICNQPINVSNRSKFKTKGIWILKTNVVQTLSELHLVTLDSHPRVICRKYVIIRKWQTLKNK